MDIIKLDGNGWHSAVYRLLEELKRYGKIEDIDSAYKSIIERENIASTYIGNNIMVPHAVIDATDNVSWIMGISRKGVKVLNSIANIIVLVVSGKRNPKKYIITLSKIARILLAENILEKDDNYIKKVFETITGNI